MRLPGYAQRFDRRLRQRRWMKLAEGGSVAAVEAGEEVVAISRVRELEKQVRELQRIIGKQAVTIEILEAARDIVKKVRTCSKDPSGDRQGHIGDLPRAHRRDGGSILRDRARMGGRGRSGGIGFHALGFHALG